MHNMPQFYSVFAIPKKSAPYFSPDECWRMKAISIPKPFCIPNQGGKVGHETLFSETGLMHPGSCQLG